MSTRDLDANGRDWKGKEMLGAARSARCAPLGVTVETATMVMRLCGSQCRAEQYDRADDGEEDGGVVAGEDICEVRCAMWCGVGVGCGRGELSLQRRPFPRPLPFKGAAG